MLWKNLKRHRLKTLFCTEWRFLENGIVSLKCPRIFSSKKGTNRVIMYHEKTIVKVYRSSRRVGRHACQLSFWTFSVSDKSHANSYIDQELSLLEKLQIVSIQNLFRISCLEKHFKMICGRFYHILYYNHQLSRRTLIELSIVKKVGFLNLKLSLNLSLYVS